MSFAAKSGRLNYLIILAIFICGGCSQEPERRILGRWELSESDLAKLRVNTPELTGKIVSYRLDIAGDNQMMVRVDVEIEGLSKGIYSSTYIWQINDGNLVAKKDTGKEFTTAINSNSEHELQLKNGLEPFENFLFSTSNETNEEKAARDTTRIFLEEIGRHIQYPLNFIRKGDAQVGDMSSSHKVEK